MRDFQLVVAVGVTLPEDLKPGWDEAVTNFLRRRDMPSIQQRVGAGAKLLDEKRPGWENEINLDILDLQFGDYCILGQLYRGYIAGLYELFGTAVLINSIEYGFHWPGLEGEMHCDLPEAWRQEILKRREVV